MIFYKLLLLIAVLLALVRLKMHLTFALLVISALTVLLYHIHPGCIIEALRATFLSADNLTILLVIIFTTYLSNLLAKRGNFNEAFSSLQEIFGDIRLPLAIIPSLIGMIPMPAGAMFSAPMVDEGGKLISLSQSHKHAINYLFRHMWELCLPLWPAILLITATFGIPLNTLLRTQIVYTLIYTALAVVFVYLPIKILKADTPRPNMTASLLSFLKNFWPMLAIVVSIFLIKLNVALIIFIILLAFILLNRIAVRELSGTFIKTFSWSIISVVVAVLFFKNLIQSSSALKDLPLVLKDIGINTTLILFFTPFLVGFLTGLTQAPVAVSFAVLLPLFYRSPEIVDYSRIMLVYVGGFMGVNFSPTHLCMCTTKEYFKADYGEIYRFVVPVYAFFIIASFVLYALGFPHDYILRH